MININFGLSIYGLLCFMLFPQIWCESRIYSTRNGFDKSNRLLPKHHLLIIF